MFKFLKRRLEENSYDTLVWILNILPRLGGYSLLSKKYNVLFWVLHLFLLVYVYFVGTVVYQLYYVENYIDSVNGYFNISLFGIIFNGSCWFIAKRNELKPILELVKENDKLMINSGRFLEKHRKSLRLIKRIVISLSMFHAFNSFCIFVPARIINLDEFSVASCVGLEPLTKSPNRQICMVILTVQEITSFIVVVSYEMILVFSIAHTTAMFDILHEDMMSLHDDHHDDLLVDTARTRLINIVHRHSLLLHTVAKLQNIYSFAIGVDFGLYAIITCLFSILPIDVCLNFSAVIAYSLSVFFAHCYLGQRLTTATEKFENAIYFCGWTNFNLQEQKIILLMLKQSQKPVVLLAADIIPIRIGTFAQTMQAIYKFVTVVKL